MEFRLVPQYSFNCLAFSVATDRSDSGLMDSVNSFAAKLKSFQGVLEATNFGYPKLTHNLSATTQFEHSESDHETVTHVVVVEVITRKNGETQTFYVEFK